MSDKNYKVDDIYGNTKFPIEGEPCVYFLKDELKNIVYVGQTISLRKRIMTHENSEIDFCYFSFCNVKDKNELSDLEAIMIVKHEPLHNKTLPKNNIYTTKAKANTYLISVIDKYLDKLDIIYSHISKNEAYSLYYIEQSKVEKIKNLITKTLDENL